MNARPKVLIVEDDANVAAVMEYLLAEVGCETVVAATGGAGIHCAQQQEFDLVILDIRLPGLTGFEVCEWLKQDFRFQRTPVVFVSGHAGEAEQRRALSMGADFISKPFEADQFLKKVCERIRR